MTLGELSVQQVFSTACPKCGAAPGECCALDSEGQRSESHMERKFAAIEASRIENIEQRHSTLKNTPPNGTANSDVGDRD